MTIGRQVAFARPTLPELVTRTRADLKSRLSATGPLLRRAVANVLAPVWAGSVHLLHGHIEWASRQLFPDTSEDEWLLRQAALYGISPTPATFASGDVVATGTNGSTIAVDEVLKHANGKAYKVTAEATIAGGQATVSVEAEEAGESSNLEAGETLTFETPIAGVDAETTVDADGIAGGNDEGSIENTRDRLVLRLQEPPAGGRDVDYEGWALSVAGVTRAWVYPLENGLGTVVVRFVMDDREDIFPLLPDVDAVQEKLDAERPNTAEVTALAPIERAEDLNITISPDTLAVRDAVTEELTDLFEREAEPGDGAGRGTIEHIKIITAIGNAAGLESGSLNSPAGDIVPLLGELVVLGNITWA